MFACIETNGATHIVINIPHEGSERSLPALARILEQNATFIRSNYSDTQIIKAAMSISLGDTFFKKDDCEHEIIIKESDAILDESFVNATPEVMTSNAKALKKERDENSRIRTELQFLRGQLEVAKAQIDALTEISA